MTEQKQQIGVFELLILSLLSSTREGRTVPELNQLLSECNWWGAGGRISLGAVYATITRLLKKEWVSKTEHAPPGRKRGGRRYCTYNLTSVGKSELDRMKAIFLSIWVIGSPSGSA